jgi:hypothetical protein
MIDPKDVTGSSFTPIVADWQTMRLDAEVFPPPLSTFHGWVKQLRPDMLEERTKAFLNLVFPGFLQSLGEANPLILTPLQDFSEGRFRRYSGDVEFSRSRYYTICRNSNGDDGGTLAAELLAYSARKQMIVWITDPSVPGHGDQAMQSQIRAQYGDQPCLYISVVELSSIENRIANLGPTVNVILPLFLSPISATQVVDLRLPETQDWFCRTFGELECNFHYLGWSKLKPKSFREMIPTLIHPARGGLVFHQAVGGWLRAQGISALIYPSARCNVYVSFENQNVASFGGWNLVACGSEDRDLPLPPTGLAHFGFLGKWLSGDEISINVEWHQSENARRWAVSGVTGRESARRENEILESLRSSKDREALQSSLEKLGFDFASASHVRPHFISRTAIFGNEE